MTELDGNKTPLTHRITAVAAAYLDGAGFKPIETEVAVAPGWIADLASFIYPSRTEAKKLRLVKGKDSRSFEASYDELMYITGSAPLTAIVEVKATRADYTKDQLRKFACPYPPANLCYLAFPNGAWTEDDLPTGLVGMETSKNGDRLRKVHNKKREIKVFPQYPGGIIDLIAAVATRRDHRTRYATMRAWMRSARARLK